MFSLVIPSLNHRSEGYNSALLAVEALARIVGDAPMPAFLVSPLSS